MLKHRLPLLLLLPVLRRPPQMERSVLDLAVPREVFEVVNALRDCGLAPGAAGGPRWGSQQGSQGCGCQHRLPPAPT